MTFAPLFFFIFSSLLFSSQVTLQNGARFDLMELATRAWGPDSLYDAERADIERVAVYLEKQLLLLSSLCAVRAIREGAPARPT